MINDIAILGIGSPFGADQIGIQLAKKLRDDSYIKKLNLNILFADRPGINLINMIAPYRLVYLLDAVLNDKPKGEVSFYSLREIEHLEKQKTSSHGLGMIEVLNLAQSLKLVNSRLKIIGISCDVDFKAFDNKECDEIFKQVKGLLSKEFEKYYEK